MKRKAVVQGVAYPYSLSSTNLAVIRPSLMDTQPTIYHRWFGGFVESSVLDSIFVVLYDCIVPQLGIVVNPYLGFFGLFSKPPSELVVAPTLCELLSWHLGPFVVKSFSFSFSFVKTYFLYSI